MKYFLFHDNNGDFPPDYIKPFKTMAAVLKYIESDIAMLEKAYPKDKWSVKDYLIAKEVK